MLEHASNHESFPASLKALWHFQIGHLGVDIFFCISGFIITYLLLEERDRTGGISLRRFYARRGLRIVPPYFLYILCIWLLSSTDMIGVAWPNFLAAITFTSNLSLVPGEWYLGHSWSLSVEEQFYLLWPSILLLLPSVGVSIRFLVLVLVASVPISIAAHTHIIPLWLGGFLRYIFPIYAGCLLAHLFKFRPALVNTIYRHPMSGLATIIGMSVAVLLSNFSHYGQFAPVTVPFRPLLTSIGIALLVGCAIVQRNWLHYILNTRGFVFFGTISYSLYLWQQLCLSNVPDWTSSLGGLPSRIALTIALAATSYYLLERPLGGLRHRLRDQRSLTGQGRAK